MAAGEKLTIEIDLGNEAMQRAEDVRKAVGRAMTQEAERYHGALLPGWNGSIRDANGNTVGKWEVA